MKKTLIFLILTIWISVVHAGTIQNSEAKIIALNWINSQGGVYFEMGDIEKVYSKIENKVSIFFIVSFKPTGWVIVSGSDIVEPVLGYSVNSHFEINNMPPNVEGWMGNISNEINLSVRNKLVPSAEIKQKWQTYRGKLIKKQSLKSTLAPQPGPLLTTTWNQGCNYNGMCPSDTKGPCGHVYVGCVATAMAQVMKYWGYPDAGMGNYSYIHPKYGTQAVDFAGTTYNWSAMPNAADPASTEIQKIGYHCAVSVDMNFGSGESSAWYSTAAFIDYFRYNSTIFKSDKVNWDDAEWKALLRREIDAGRPVLYSGTGVTGGHAFVCDGYSSDDFFYFNWGWGGLNNGKFLLFPLNPGGRNYSNSQAAIFSIEPVKPASIRIPYHEGFESTSPDGISLMGVNEMSTEQPHIGDGSLKLGKESIFCQSTNAASLCFLVPSEAELNFWVKRFTSAVSANNQQKAYIMPQFGSTPLVEIFNGDYNDSDWVSFNVDLSAFTGQIVRLLILQEVRDNSKQQWMYIDDISISGLNNNVAPFIPSNPSPSNLADFVSLTPTLHWSGGDLNGDDLIYKVYFGTTATPSLVGSVFTNNYTPPALSHTTKYYWKIVADDDSLTTEGPLWSFRTKGIPPTMGNCGISNLTSNSITICGQILNYNLSEVSSRGICWSQNQNPSFATNYVEARGSSDVFSCGISGLLPYTKYYYNALARSDQGDSYSQVLDFRTLPSLPVVSIEGVDNIFRSKATINCKINAINDSSIIRRGVVWSTNTGFDPSMGHIVSENGNWTESGSFKTLLTNLPGPGNFYYRVFAENSVGITYSNESLITTINEIPFIDLDANNSRAWANDFNGICEEQLPGGIICDSDVEITDHDSDPITQLKVKLLNAYNNSELEFLKIFSDNENLIIEGNGTQELLISASKSLTYNEWEDVLKSIEYRNNLDAPHPEIIREIRVQVSDGFDLSNLATAFLEIKPVNDPPVNKIPPTFDTAPIFDSRVRVLRGVWADSIDNLNGVFEYSYTWQKKNDDSVITILDFEGHQIVPIDEFLCGYSIRVIEKVTDINSGGSNIVVNQAESKWYSVGKISQTISVDPIPVHNYNERFFTFSGRASSGLPLSYNLFSHNNVLSTSNDTAYIQGAGREAIIVIQPGNDCFLPSNSWIKNVEITKGVQEIICQTNVVAKYHTGFMKIPARATSGLGVLAKSSDPSIAFIKNDTIYFSGTGEVTLEISQPGNNNYFPSDTVKMFLNVLKGDQSISTHFPNELYYGMGKKAFKAVSTSMLDVKVLSSDPSIIEFSGDSLIVRGVGKVFITASQYGNNLWNPAKDIVDTLVVKKGIQNISVEAVGDKVVLGSSFVPNYHLSTNLGVTISIRDTTIADVVGGKIVLKKAGETFIRFHQGGNDFWEPVYTETPLKVIKANQVITFNNIENQYYGAPPIRLTALSNSGLNVVFEISDKEIATIHGDSLYVHNAGSAQITASQPGNDQYNPANRVSITLIVGKVNQSIISHLPDSLVEGHKAIFADVESTSGLKVKIASSNVGIVKVGSDSLYVIDDGEVVLTLTQSGNRNYDSIEISVKLIVTPGVDVYSLGNSLVSIFPNPTEGKASLLVNGNLNFPLRVSIFNSTGKTIDVFETGNLISFIDLSKQPQGLYFVVVRSQKWNITQKLLIAR